jgi:hypothetical protein
MASRPHWYGSIQSLADQGVVALWACMFVEPAGSCLVAAPPLEPAGCVAGRLRPGERVGEQSPDLPDGERDEAGVGGRCGIRAGGRWCLGVGAVPEPGCGDGADRGSGHDQHDVARDRGVEPTSPARGIATRLEPVEDSLATSARVCLRMPLRATDDAGICCHGTILTQRIVSGHSMTSPVSKQPWGLNSAAGCKPPRLPSGSA